MLKSLLTFALLFFCLASYGQNNSTKERLLREIAETEAEIAELQASANSQDKENRYCFEKVVYKELPPMSNEDFLEACKNELQALDAIGAKNNYSILSSCKRTAEGYQASFCVTTTPNVVEGMVSSTPTISETEAAINKIRNTKSMYESLIQSLYDELKSNGIEIADQGLNLGVKHLKIEGVTGDVLKSQVKELKDKMIEDVKTRYNITGETIENENAQLVDDVTNQGEKLLGFIPGGSLVTCHYLWRILKSTPEIGRIIGNGGAVVNIYFQINEFNEKLRQLNTEEERLLKSIDAGRQPK